MDIRLAFRALVRYRASTAAIVLTLGVAIGANVTAYSVVDAVLLRPLPYPDAEQIVTVAAGRRPIPGGTGELPFSDRGYWHFSENNRVFEHFGGYSTQPFDVALTAQGTPLRLTATPMTLSAFEAIGVLPEIGRFPTVEEDVPNGALVVMLSNGLWIDRFGSDPTIIGRNILLNDVAFEVIGVMPANYDFPTPDIDAWVPYRLDAASENFGQHRIDGVARLAPGMSVDDARADAERLIARFTEAGYEPSWLTDIFTGTAVVQTLQNRLVGSARTPLMILFLATGFVLAIACSNVANLYLVRSEGRRHQSAIFLALGAPRGRLARYVFAETLMLALIGGALGLVLAVGATQALVAIGPASIPRLDAISIQPHVLLYGVGISLLAAILFGILPALSVPSAKKLSTLLSQGRNVGGSRRATQDALVVVQVALALVLLIGTGLMVRTYDALRNVDPGFEPEGVTTFSITPRPSRHQTPEAAAQFYDELIAELERIPGVTSAGGINTLPLTGTGSRGLTRLQGVPLPEGEVPPSFFMRRVTPGYFETMGIPVVEGRSFSADDHNRRIGSVIVSQSIRDDYWPGETGIGKRVVSGPPTTTVGVVGDVHALGVQAGIEPHVYKPMLDSVGGSVWAMNMVLRSELEALELIPAIRRAVGTVDGDVAIGEVRSMSEIVSDSMSRTTVTMTLLAVAAIVALLLGSLGIYGVVAHVVSLRSFEITLRMALGAEASVIRRTTIIFGLKRVLVGVAIGLIVAASGVQLMSSLLYGVEANDVASFIAGSITFIIVAVAAAAMPAIRAARLPLGVALQEAR